VAANSSATVDLGLLNTATLASLAVPMTYTGTSGLTNQLVKSVSGITRTSTTATATSTAHGYSNGDVVLVSGAVQTDYNINATISNVTADTFDYTVANTPTTPATGTILVRKRSHLIQPATVATFGAAGNNTSVTGSGPNRWKHDFGSVQTTITVLNTSQSSADSGLEPLRIIGTHASNVIYVLGGTTGLATSDAAEVATLATINQTGGVLNGGAGLTWTNIFQSGGTLNLTSGAAAGVITQSSGDCRITGAGTIANLTIGGTLTFDLRKASAGDTITGALTLNDNFTLDLTRNPANLSVTALTINGNGRILTNKANPGHFSWTTLIRNPGSQVSFE
jgi:hypothetical protein